MRAQAARRFAAIGAWLAARPWTHWAIAYASLVLFYHVDRCVGVDALVALYGDESDTHSVGIKMAVMAFGLLEDLVCATYFVFFLWLTDAALRLLSRGGKRWQCFVVTNVVRFVWYFALYVIFAAPVAADILLVRWRQFRFTSALIATAIKEKDNASSLHVARGELHEGYVTLIATLVTGLAFGIVGALWLDLSAWHPFDVVRPIRSLCVKENYDLLPAPQTGVNKTPEKLSDVALDGTDAETDSEAPERMEKGEAPELMEKGEAPELMEKGEAPASDAKLQGDDVNETASETDSESASSQDKRQICSLTRLRRWRTRTNWDWLRIADYVMCTIFFLVMLPIILALFAERVVSPLVSDAALNTTLNELLGHSLGTGLLPNMADGTIASAAIYLDSDTEDYQLVSNDSLYRTTLGFRGDLAFDVSVNSSDLPNVLVLVVESFRYHDSQYLVANNTYLLKDKNITITPQFDRWAKRGIAFHNYWSSWRTSRSVESILFGQLPYDSIPDSGMTGGHADVKLSGMPQFFKVKGYSTKFTTGCILNYDGWDKFFKPHGFDEVLGNNEFRQFAEKDLGITPNDWLLVSKGGKSRAMRHWGVHDDVALEVLGNILLNETAAQRERVVKGEAKRPLFINHYTISSHTPYKDRPQWYDKMDKPDFSPLYNGEKYWRDVKNYMEMRYFTDMALGKFLDRMEAEGVLNDTIVVITGDHGQGPEYGLDTPEAREISATRVAGTLIAEGRLGKYAGMMYTDVAEQYDLLNTLADIVGVPEGGFVQDGVGRSLKRKYQSETPRVVYSNNPSRKLSVVQGSERLEFDAMSTAVALHNVETDHDLQHDLFPALDGELQRQWRTLRDHGVRLDGYFKERWDRKCLLSASC